MMLRGGPTSDSAACSNVTAARSTSSRAMTERSICSCKSSRSSRHARGLGRGHPEVFAYQLGERSSSRPMMPLVFYGAFEFVAFSDPPVSS